MSASFIPPGLRLRLDREIKIPKLATADAAVVQESLKRCGVRHYGKLIQYDLKLISVLVGWEAFCILSEQAEKLDLHFQMDVGDWEPPGINQAYII
jgi:hypothetical protein